MVECEFCVIKSRSGERILFEDDLCLVLPDKNPVEKGHLLIISKAHYGSMLDAPEEVVMRMFALAKLFGLRLKNSFSASGMNIGTNIGRQAGQRIPHFHVHVIPRYPGRSGLDAGKELNGKELEMLKKD